MIAYDFHPEVRRDLDEIWDFVATDNPEAADRLIAEIVDAVDALVPFPMSATDAPTSPDGPCASFRCVNT
jgi:plasmid stabilization system protein ParE